MAFTSCYKEMALPGRALLGQMHHSELEIIGGHVRTEGL